MSETITIYCKNNNTYKDVPIGSSLLDIYTAVGAPLRYRPMNAQVNNKTESLSFRCWQPKDIEFIDYTQLSGLRTYVRSLCHIFSKAVYDIWPTATLNLEHPVSKGYYCVIHNGKDIDPETIEKIKKRMWELIDADLPFLHKSVRTVDAAVLFRERGMNDKARLIETAGLPYTSYYELEGYINFFYGCLTPSTGYIQLFDLEPYMDGVLLRIPKQTDPMELQPVIKQDKMFEAYKEHLTLQRTVGLDNVGDLNLAIEKGRSQDIILVSEAMQEKQVAKIAEKIADGYKEGIRIVLISGPSSSGKTTFCKRLQVQLTTNLLYPVGISLDDYFLNREDTPKDEHGEYDFESLYALDLPYFNRDLKKLLSGEEIELPSFNFETGQRVFKGKKLKLRENSILVIEGIHALNPELTEFIDDKYKYRVYVSVLTSISLDNHNWIPTTDNRLLRRIIRDYRFRGYSAEDTINRWPSVRRGEDKWIFPYQENADAMFNSAMLYELAALRKFAEPILAQVPESSKANAEAYRLLRFLRYFNYIPTEELPGTSLLREFLGGGSFKY
ncbi:nucleoside kinase [Parabacteroides distasonis]|uniref:nucleoside kinase n=1 Tax=Parabacteroides distasonis TaxID=823 RepID=UPI00189CE8B9|nr:nucleoside kinase [Parabacteroides distasonis]MDB9149935.1 nucleoside kinase [Parabacteroides distasonis]MDB9154698.1 nucleoside kinase [Parabacteroides distasonis]MDB9163703.1 nucleoside kinase [Parabacteroides distasonis]MDB9168150.1 nucleoside kinase [Parabacteroides distasonis]MDB9194899.1 nucleoside kinase [Parabacteroides distasonis]